MIKENKPEKVIVMKTWQFFASQILLFIAICTFAGKVYANLDTKYYAKVRGETLEIATIELRDSIKELNNNLTNLRIVIASRLPEKSRYEGQ